ncbi:uncharacterized protein BYT42DRAFT_618457 [Radiomyces spectabilis]|uniref:uncharacterized protein n=1 Tax=Radiomyces spectabilis TaxID=64574 RepID=UPI0022208187|nr:uncharacterized protein BYT42DRAFT_618457 [Radiomyces spectabilis]KAI8366015.1 hypothetical protein BYT42DRAFT_618457 [Radiomyces spectabilis]
MARQYPQPTQETGQNGHIKHAETNGHAAAKPLPEKSRFVARVSSYPIVQDGVAYYQRTLMGRITASTWTTLEKYSSYQPKSFQAYYENYVVSHLDKADQLGCRSLDLIQSKVPLITQPTAEIVEAVKQPSYQLIEGVKGRLTLNNVSRPAQTVAREANQRLTVLIDNLEAVMDRYLEPLPSDAGQEKGPVTKEEDPLLRAYIMFGQASSRLRQQLTRTIADLPRTRDDLKRLAETSSIVQSATANLQLFQEMLRHSIVIYSQAAQDRLPPAVKERVQYMHAITTERLHQLTQQMGQLVDTVKTQSTEVPERFKLHLQSLLDVANQQLELARQEYAREDISSYHKAKNVAQNVQEQVMPVLQTIQAQIQQYTDSTRQKLQADLALLRSKKVADTDSGNDTEPESKHQDFQGQQ